MKMYLYIKYSTKKLIKTDHFLCKQNTFYSIKIMFIISLYHSMTKSGLLFVCNPPQNVCDKTCKFHYSPNFKRINLVQLRHFCKLYS